MLIPLYISDLMFGVEPWLTGETACSFPEPWSPREESTAEDMTFPSDTPLEPLEEYIGVYNHPGFGDITILLSEDNKQLYFYFGQFMEAILRYNASENKFYTKGVGKFWFMGKYPVHFEKQQSSHNFDTLYMPMSRPWGDAFPFLNGKAKELRQNVEEGKDKKLCSGAINLRKTVIYIFTILLICL